MLNNIILRLLLYYAAWFLALSGIFHLFPKLTQYHEFFANLAQQVNQIDERLVKVEGKVSQIDERLAEMEAKPPYMTGKPE